MKRTLTFILLLVPMLVMRSQIAVGSWRDHLSYTTLYQAVVTDDRVYASAAGGLFYYDLEDNTTERLNKANRLNDIGISVFDYDPQSRMLVIAYNNSNIDIIKDDKVYNINDIKRADIGGDKRINGIAFRNHCAYLACGFGVVVVDLNRMEIKETYYLGADGTYLNINDIAFTDELIVVATSQGLMTADKESHLLNIVSNWQRDTTSLLAGREVSRIEVDGSGKLMALTHDDDSLSTIYTEAAPMVFVPWLSGDLRTMKMSQGKTIVVWGDRVELYAVDGTLQHTVGDFDWFKAEVNDAAMSSDGMLWMAHRWASLTACNPADAEATLTVISPQGPGSDNVYRLVSWNNELLVCPGGHSTTYTGIYLPAELYTFSDNRWGQIADPQRLLGGAMDIVGVAVNPRNTHQMMAASWGYGVFEIVDGQVTALYNDANSDGALMPYEQGSYKSLFTGGVAFDRKGNLWITNSLQSNGLAVRYSDGSWNSFNTNNMVAGSDIDKLICDSLYGYKLFCGRANRIFVHDGEGLMAYIDPNNGAKLETSSVQCLAQDHSGNIWIGTNKGIKVIYDLSRAFQNGGAGEKSPVTCSNILYSENGINEYLMAYESVTAIAVDGANRKWVGTSNGGLYLLSANGLEQIEHFTAANSHLFSDKILSLSVMPWSGEVFVGTDKGLQSFRGTATYAYAEPQDDIHAFPNPVRPDYDGPIAIKGFSRNALVHITDADGKTVFSTTANGGQAIWSGRTSSGERVASGVYYVFASSTDGGVRSVAKILIVR